MTFSVIRGAASFFLLYFHILDIALKILVKLLWVRHLVPHSVSFLGYRKLNSETVNYILAPQRLSSASVFFSDSRKILPAVG